MSWARRLKRLFGIEVQNCYDDIEERFGVVPERMTDVLALMGDAVDDIPGMPGVGRETAFGGRAGRRISLSYQ